MVPQPTRVAPAPCLCGHVHTWSAPCTTCPCELYAPDYVAQATAAGLEPSDELRELTRDVASRIGWHRPGVDRVQCVYCEGWFHPKRSDATTCSGDCRVSLHRARTLESDADLVPVSRRKDRYSVHRARATGRGLMTCQEQYDADVRVRRGS